MVILGSVPATANEVANEVVTVTVLLAMELETNVDQEETTIYAFHLVDKRQT